MNWEHFQAFVWLRWRLRRNQLRRDGFASAVIMGILAVVLIGCAAALFIGLFLTGWRLLGEASPGVVLYVWDGLVLGFLFAWAAGLLTDLQRSDVLSLDKLLHLPVSLTGAFVINYLSSMISLSLILFLAAAAGLSLGLCLSQGPAMLLLLPLTAAFVLMVTALTHQFQGWLASLMANQRRRRTVIVLATFVLILVSQGPNLVFNGLRPWSGADQLREERKEELAELQRAEDAKEITTAESVQRRAQVWKTYHARQEEVDQRTSDQWERGIWFANLVLPPGWLPLGAMASAQGRGLAALLPVLGLTLIGGVSLWRSYRTMLRLYTGYYTARAGRPVSHVAPKKGGRVRVSLLERQLPGVSEPVSAVALASLTSLLRAPEVKLVLGLPLVLLLIFGSMFLARSGGSPEPMRPFVPLGAMAVILLTANQLFGNQFGLDRGGFRVFVLGPASRRDILLGKNLAVAPLVLGTGLALAVVLQIVFPMPLDCFLALPFAFVSMYLAFCLLANLLSIFAPHALAVGTLKPAKMTGSTFLFQLAFLVLVPVVLLPTLLPVGIAVALAEWGGITGWPICLPLALAECVGVIYLYRMALHGEGRLLQAREQAILAVVAVKED